MRKCIVSTNTRVIRNDEELMKLWNDHIAQFNESSSIGINGYGIDPDIDSIDRRNFFRSNSGYHEKKEVFGLFHQWGNDYEEFESGPGNYTVAVVELADGSVITCHTDNIKFLPPSHGGFEGFPQWFIDREVGG